MSSAKKSAAKKVAAKNRVAKKGSSKKTTAKRAAAKKASANKSVAKKQSKKKATAKKSAKPNKTVQKADSPASYIASIDHKIRQRDAKVLLKWFADVTGLKPRMWGSSIIGYGRYYYQYDSGRSGESMMTGFSPRAASMSIYIMPGYRDMSEKLARLGKHKIGKSCLYITNLDNIDMDVLAEMVTDGVDYMRANYKTWDV